MRSLAAALVLVLVAVGALSASVPLPPIAPLPEAAFRPVPSPPRASAPPPTVITDTQGPQPTRPTVVVPTSRMIVIEPLGPSRVTTGGSSSLSGVASWYCKEGVSVCHYAYPPGSMVAAACGRLRAAMGSNWRGKHVAVLAANGNSVVVQLVDWCGSTSKTIDLYWEPMRRLGGTGVLSVIVTW